MQTKSSDRWVHSQSTDLRERVIFILLSARTFFETESWKLLTLSPVTNVRKMDWNSLFNASVKTCLAIISLPPLYMAVHCGKFYLIFGRNIVWYVIFSKIWTRMKRRHRQTASTGTLLQPRIADCQQLPQEEALRWSTTSRLDLRKQISSVM